MVALLFAPGKWEAPPLPSKEKARTPPGVQLPIPNDPFYKKLAARLLKRLLPWPIQLVLEDLSHLWPSNKVIITPAGWQVHCQRVTPCPNTPGIRPCAQTWGPSCVGTGGCTCANVGQTFPGSSQDGTKKQTWIYELSPLLVCNRMIYHAFLPSCPATVWQSPHQAKPRPAQPTARRARPRHPGVKRRRRTPSKTAPSRRPKRFMQPRPQPTPTRPPYNPPPQPMGKPPGWPDPMPKWIPQIYPPDWPDPDTAEPLPFEDIPKQPDWLPFPPDEVSIRGPGPNRGVDVDPTEDFDLDARGQPGPDQAPTRPAPGVRRGPGGIPWPNVLPAPRPGDPNPAPQPAQPPPTIRSPVTVTAPGAGIRMEPPSPAVRFPGRPPRRTKNPKFILAIRAGSGIGRAVNIATEGFDLVDCLHKALPARLQSKPKWHKSDAPSGWTRNNSISLKTKMRDLYKSVDSRLTPLEAAKALGNALQHCIDNALEDKQFGLIGKQMAKASRRNGAMHGLTIGGNARRRAGQFDLRMAR